NAVEKYETELSKMVLAGFGDIKGLRDMSKVKVYGLTDLKRLEERDPTFAFKVENKSDQEIVNRLWIEGGIAARTEDYYSRALEPYNQQNMIRISLVHYNTPEEISVFLKSLMRALRMRER
ncbi:aminotransferase class V-fold PLP-dependent enzyme, partial [Candidatus Bathyarchaeota archaeon]|nr:aminotransferase class V-fold PLP-dependent enzyme [Candidatus Bathyarchaeota archaeon]